MMLIAGLKALPLALSGAAVDSWAGSWDVSATGSALGPIEVTAPAEGAGSPVAKLQRQISDHVLVVATGLLLLRR